MVSMKLSSINWADCPDGSPAKIATVLACKNANIKASPFIFEEHLIPNMQIPLKNDFVETNID
jgi:hypothetical protein